MRTLALTALLLTGAAASTASADIVKVSIYGVVYGNGVTAPPLGGNGPGSAVTVTFELDSNNFVNSPNFPVRGYVVDQASFSMKVGNGTVGLQNPFPAGEVPYFVLRNNDPGVDGFYMSTDVDGPNGVPLNQNGIFGAFRNDFSVTYTANTLSSLSILGAVGNYDFTNLTNFNWIVADGPFDAIGIDFDHMVIEVVPAPSTLLPFAAVGIFARRRRN